MQASSPSSLGTIRRRPVARATTAADHLSDSCQELLACTGDVSAVNHLPKGMCVELVSSSPL
jgi:hypothetical protein